MGLQKENQNVFIKQSNFTYTNLDSIVEITEKYAFLNSQPAKTPELTQSLKRDEFNDEPISRFVREDLYSVLRMILTICNLN